MGVEGWNEIDAVALVDGKGGVQWASAATASSSYADRSAGEALAGAVPANLGRFDFAAPK